jgi:glucose/arabinose dehydrogenase
MSHRHPYLAGLIVLLLLMASWAPPAGGQTTTGAAFDWRDDWALADGFTMAIDSEGYHLPSNIAFVPNPGSAPTDPLYFVLELKGTLKVVTNDRTVHSFATNILPIAAKEEFQGFGATGLCLDPKRGNVYVTFAYLDETLTYRNGMARFASKPGTFGLKALGRTDFTELFAHEKSHTSHQIGPCLIRGDELFVAVGYGIDRSQSQNLSSTLGSVLRMTTDFKPFPDNPFYTDDKVDTAIDYIWTYGHRNVFGLKQVEGRLYATENGGGVDRFNELHRGENYMWRGTDWSFATRADYLFAPSLGLVHLDWLAPDSDLFPERFRDAFFIASAGAPGGKGPGRKGQRSIVVLEYDRERNRPAAAPWHLLKYRGDGMQLPVSVAFGPDGLYFLPLLANRAGENPVYRIAYDPQAAWPHNLSTETGPQDLLWRYDCRSCHRIFGSGGSIGPALDTNLGKRIEQRLASPGYAERVAAVDRLDFEPYAGLREARRAILETTGRERTRRWLETYLQEPAFDNPDIAMVNLGVSAGEARVLADYLLGAKAGKTKPAEATLLNRGRFLISRFIPTLRYRHLALAFALGAVLSGIAVFLAVGKRRRRRDDRRGPAGR